MNQKNLLENIIIDCIVEHIADSVVDKIIQKSKKGLLLFTGANIGFDESIKCINNLKKDGWVFDVVMSKSAVEVLSVEKVKESIGAKNIITNENMCVIKDLLQNNNVIIIPTLTINSASKIANCISDTLVTNIVSKALMSGKSIIASVNGCCPQNEERKRIYGDNLSDFHKAKLSENLQTLKNYKIKLSSSENLYNNANKILLKSFNIDKYNNQINAKNENIAIKAKHKENIEKSYITLNKKILSRKDIWDNKKYSAIYLNNNTLITDLAKEEAKKYNIKLLKK